MISDWAPNGRGGWRDRAACRFQPARWFTDPADAEDIRRALATCITCPVRKPCLDVALAHPIEADVGIWGGTTEHTRRRIRDEGLTAAEALQQRDLAQPETPAAARLRGQQAARRHEATGQRAASTMPLRTPVPELTVARDAHGDYTDVSGRVILFRIHRDPPWMVMVDGRPIARTDTLAHGRQIAWSALNDPQRQHDRHAEAQAAGRGLSH